MHEWKTMNTINYQNILTEIRLICVGLEEKKRKVTGRSPDMKIEGLLKLIIEGSVVGEGLE